MSVSNYQPVNNQERDFRAVSCPVLYEGVGRALQHAFRDPYELPGDMRDCLARLDSIERR